MKSKQATASEPLSVALIGCGQIADAHLQEIRKIKAARMTSVCDLHRDLAIQAAARFDVPSVYDDVAVMLAEVRPQVVHVATPAHIHFAVARQCLLAGCHVYVEKPFTQTVEEAEALTAIAGERGLKLCVGHDQLFDPAWLALRQRVENGEIGEVRHVESVLGYPISGQFGSQVAADPRHWVRRLPGGLFHNTISHPLYRITEFLTDETPHIDARWQTRPPYDFPTELWVQLRGRSVTGSLTFASTIEAQRFTRVYGTQGALEVDLDGQVIRRIGASKAPGAFCKLATPWSQWREGARNLRRNAMRFLKSDIHYFAGLRGLCERFYDAIQTGSDVPIAASEILRVTRIMDRIFDEARTAGGEDRSLRSAVTEREIRERETREPKVMEHSR
jgi:predicted dehydrogenase